MWRLSLTFSLLSHAALALAFWLLADRVDPRALSIAPPVDTRAREVEINLMVSALDSPPIIRPHVDPPPAVPPAASRIERQGDKETRGQGDKETSRQGEPSSGPRVGEASSARPTATAFFQVATPAQSVVYVIDCSGSMGSGGRLALARHELRASLERLPPSARFQVIPYNRRAAPLRIDGRTDLVAATPSNKEAAVRMVEAVLPEGGTDHRPALQAALRLQPEAIYFLTDADDLSAELVRTLTRSNGGRTAIHAIELTAVHRDRPDMPLQVLARDNRGNYRGVDLK